METPHTLVYLFSKYSGACKTFNEMLSSSGIDYLTPLCVDNKDVRKTVMSSKFNIQFLPCILFVYASGNIEKYEGDNCFQWLNEIIKRNQTALNLQSQNLGEIGIPKNEDIFETKAPPKTKISNLSLNKKLSFNDTSKRGTKNEEILSQDKEEEEVEEVEEVEEEEEEEEAERNFQNKKSKIDNSKIKKSEPKRSKSKIENKNLTNLEDLLMDENEETSPEEESSNQYDPSMFLKSNVDIPTSKKDNKLSNIMTKAQEMQKMRESMDTNPKKPPFPTFVGSQ